MNIHMRQWRCYLIGFREDWAMQNKSLCRELIVGADFCADSAEGVEVGERFNTRVIREGKDKRPIPKDLVCIAHEHGGKIIIVQEYKPGLEA